MSETPNTNAAEATPPSAAVREEQGAAPMPSATQWSWGAFMFDPVFLIATRYYKYLLVYLLMLIPFLNLIVFIGIKVYLGLKGAEMAARSRAFKNESEVTGFMNAFDHAGKILFFVTIAIMVIGFVLALLGLNAMFDSYGGGY